VNKGAFAGHGRAERPTTPDETYGVPRRGGTRVEWEWVEQQLQQAADYWVTTVRPDGRPHSAPIWGIYDADNLYLETSPATLKARNLSRDERASVHIGGGSAVVIVDGVIRAFMPDAATGARLAPLMAAKYQGYEPSPHDWDEGGLYLLIPSVVLAWREMNTATRWRYSR
jgi:nitroimidazol reductase NimA-like FMN-containing flavoprotein (pyridoxamine 5'-phosphate oxidase superfamily)